ncbi:unnamed protein product [Malus baccata var. baccata]
MTDVLISTLLEKLASTSYEYVAEEVKLVLNVKKEVEEFGFNLQVIRAVLEDAEQRQVIEASVRNWLDNLKEISYDMVDVLDDWNEILRQQVEKQETEGASAVVSKKKVRFSICLCCLRYGHVDRVIHRHKISREIKDLNERLAVIYKIREMFRFQHIEKGIQKPQTSSFVDVPGIFGRETEKDSLVRKLVSDASEEGRGLLIIPIVGMGGMGKTTLAQLAYNDANVNAHFKKKIWICVSESFDVMKIAKMIIGDESISSDELDYVLQRMSKSIEEEKFLLVLDDVWNEDSTQWDQLKVPLMRNSAEGSRILVTTRKDKVAIMMRSTTFMINLGELDEQHCLSIFNHMTFPNREADEYEVFGDISREIVKKCKGLPLVAKTLGSLMRNKRTMKEWKDVLDSKIWDWKEVEEEVFRPLLLSYYDLIPVDRCCLLYCGIFPKDYELERDILINLWMAQDYLDSEENKDKGIIGNIVFDNLVAWSFFQDFEKDVDSGKIICCKMHDIVHDFVHFLTKNECLITEANQGANIDTEVLGGKVRHLTLTSFPYSLYSLPTSCDNCKKLRTLTVFGSRSSLPCIDASLVLQLKCLRTLNLFRCSMKELPEEIGQLVHLRHLDLSGNIYLKKLPDSICSLYNLYTLIIWDCLSLSKLPRNMSKLTNLRHLYVANCAVKYLPKGIGRLTSLQTLDVCVLFFGRNDKAFKFGDLTTLNNLRGSLAIVLKGDLIDVSEVVELPLVDKKQIFNLRIDCWDPFQMTPESNLQTLNALQPQEDLESLGIYKVVAPTWPKWLTCLNRLRFLTLEFCENWETLPPLGKLPFLERLKLSSMGRVEKVGGEFLGLEDDQAAFKSSSSVFPKLKYLCFEGIWAWKEWEGVRGWKKEDSKFPTIMPYLSSLTIEDCSNLETLPDFLCQIPLQNLYITDCQKLTDRCTEASGEEWPKISHIQKIIRL